MKVQPEITLLNKVQHVTMFVQCGHLPLPDDQVPWESAGLPVPHGGREEGESGRVPCLASHRHKETLGWCLHERGTSMINLITMNIWFGMLSSWRWAFMSYAGVISSLGVSRLAVRSRFWTLFTRCNISTFATYREMAIYLRFMISFSSCISPSIGPSRTRDITNVGISQRVKRVQNRD